LTEPISGSGETRHPARSCALARSLIEAEGGRLIVARARAAPEVRIVVPAET